MTTHTGPGTDARTRFVLRETLALAALAVAALGVFQLTRVAADWERRLTRRDAAAWYDVGLRELQSGRADDAVDSLRHAVTRDRSDRTYGIALARALVAAGRMDDARFALIDLRESAPDDPQTSVELARLAAGRGDVTEASRYYRSALYAEWDAGRADVRTRLHVEFIRFLLSEHQQTGAEAELLALTPNLPENAATRVEAGQLMLAAGDPTRAREQFVRAIAIERRNPEALAGAGEAAFATGDYAAAGRYLGQLREPSPRARDLLHVSALVLSSDPLAERLPVSERRIRLAAAIARVARRIDACRSAQPATAVQAGARLDAMRDETAEFARHLTPRAVGTSPDLIETGVDLVYRLEHESVELCGTPTGPDEALLIIGTRRRGPSQ